MTDPDQLLLDGRTVGEADAAQEWHRMDLGVMGRVLAASPADPCAVCVTLGKEGYAYGRWREDGTMEGRRGLTAGGLAGVLMMHGQAFPPRADMVWLAGGVA